MPDRSPYIALSTPTSTRLVILHPGKVNDDIKCALKEVDLQSSRGPPVFSAVSYTWDTSGPENEIQVGSTFMPVRKNLFTLLQRLRNDQVDQYLWIDQLSINQQDTAEKAIQIKMMGRIYSQASEVKAWVGEHEYGSEVLFRDPNLAHKLWKQHVSALLRRRLAMLALRKAGPLLVIAGILSALLVALVRGARRDKSKGRQVVLTAIGSIFMLIVFAGFVTMSTWSWIVLLKTDLCSQEFTRICPEWAAFVKRRYWSRQWIVQEVALAKRVTIYCGSDSADWQQLMEPFNGFRAGQNHLFYRKYDKTLSRTSLYKLYPSTTGVPFLHSIRQPWQHPERFTLNDLIIATEYTECSEANDRIYALLPLVTRHVGNTITPDYQMPFLDLVATALNPDTGYKLRLCKSLKLSEEERKELLWRWAYPQHSWQPRYIDRLLGINASSSLLGPLSRLFKSTGTQGDGTDLRMT